MRPLHGMYRLGRGGDLDRRRAFLSAHGRFQSSSLHLLRELAMGWGVDYLPMAKPVSQITTRGSAAIAAAPFF